MPLNLNLIVKNIHKKSVLIYMRQRLQRDDIIKSSTRSAASLRERWNNRFLLQQYFNANFV